MATKHYGVALFEEAVPLLEPFAMLWLKRAGNLAYFNCKSVDPAGPYLHMVLEHIDIDGKLMEAEVQIPHSFVRGIVNAHNLKAIGFTAEP